MLKQHSKIDSTQHQKIIHVIFDEGRTTTEAARRFGYPRSTVYAIAKAFDNEGRMEQKHRGGNRPKRLSSGRIEWLSDRLSARPDTTITILCQELNDHFNFDPPVSAASVSRAVCGQAGYILKLLRQEPADYNSPERIHARQVWAQAFLELAASIMDVVFVDEAGFNVHMVRRFRRALRGRRPVGIRPTSEGKNLSVVVAVGREGIIASEVKLGAYNTTLFENFFLEKVVPNSLLLVSLSWTMWVVMHRRPSKTALNAEDTLYNDFHLTAPT